MLDWLKFGEVPKISTFEHSLTRERLIQAGRIVVIDDENPPLIGEMQKEGFAVDHDTTGQDLHNLEAQIYDVAIIDYHGVGQRLGSMQGLDLVKHPELELKQSNMAGLVLSSPLIYQPYITKLF